MIHFSRIFHEINYTCWGTPMETPICGSCKLQALRKRCHAAWRAKLMRSPRSKSDENFELMVHWIGLRENLNRKPMGFLPSKKKGFPVKIFPSSNSMNGGFHGEYEKNHFNDEYPMLNGLIFQKNAGKKM